MFDSRKQAGEMLDYTLMLPNGSKYPHNGHIAAGTGAFNAATQAMTIAVEFENPEFLLRPGLAVTVQSSVREK